MDKNNNQSNSNKSGFLRFKNIKDREKNIWIYFGLFILSLIAFLVPFIYIGATSGFAVFNCYYLIIYFLMVIGAFIIWLFTKRNIKDNLERASYKLTVDDIVKEKERKKKEKKDFRFIEESLCLPIGTIRGFLMLCLMAVILVFVIQNSYPPVHFIVAFNIVLLYYEIKPEEALPKEFRAKIPEGYGTLSRMPVVDKALDDVKNIFKDIKELVKKAKEGADDLQEKIEIFETKSDDVIKKFKDFAIKGRSILENIGLMGLLFGIGIISIWFIETETDPFNAITISLAAFVSAISIGFGLNLQDMMVNYIEPQVNEIFLVANKSLKVIKACLDDINKKSDKILEQIDKFKKTNVLVYFPKDIVAAISVNLMTLICGIILLIPLIALVEFFLILLEFIIGYYFLTK